MDGLLQKWYSLFALTFHYRYLCFAFHLIAVLQFAVFCPCNTLLFMITFITFQGGDQSKVYKTPEGECLFKEKLDFNAEPPWDPSWYWLTEQVFHLAM